MFALLNGEGRIGPEILVDIALHEGRPGLAALAGRLRLDRSGAAKCDRRRYYQMSGKPTRHSILRRSTFQPTRSVSAPNFIQAPAPESSKPDAGIGKSFPARAGWQRIGAFLPDSVEAASAPA
jgi:hypothetical protein